MCPADVSTFTSKQVGIILKKDFENAAIDDIRAPVTSIERRLSDNTKCKMRIMLERFYKWRRGPKEYPAESMHQNFYWQE